MYPLCSASAFEGGMQKGYIYFFCTQVHRVFLDLYTNYTILGQNSRFQIYRKKI